MNNFENEKAKIMFMKLAQKRSAPILVTQKRTKQNGPRQKDVLSHFFLSPEKKLEFGGGAIRPLSKDGGVEKLHGDPTVGPRPKVRTRGQKWKK